MILRSGKILLKRSKYSSSGGDQDIISNKLPEALLIHILSLLPDPLDAIRTCVLSKRWKHLWVFLPNLYFSLPDSFRSVEQVKTFQDSVDNALALRGGMLVRRFFLSCSSLNYDHGRVLDSLSIAVKSKLEILELKFSTYKNLRLSWDFFKATTLVELTLRDVCVLDVPQDDEFLFPCLKKVKLTSVDYLGDQSPQHLISHCPVLQELCLAKQRWYSLSMKPKIASPYLKRLRIHRCCDLGRELSIDTPRLEYLYIEDDSCIKYSLTNPLLSLVEAHIDNVSETVVELLTRGSVAKGLTLGFFSLWAIRKYHNNNVPTMFPNLVKLDVDIKYRWEFWSLLFNLLNKMPLLEQFTISYLHLPIDIDHTSGILPLETPSCLRFKMKEITILNIGVVTRRQVILIDYLLRHSTVLERLTLNANDIEQELRKELLNFQCGSHMCRIELV